MSNIRQQPANSDHTDHKLSQTGRPIREATQRGIQPTLYGTSPLLETESAPLSGALSGFKKSSRYTGWYESDGSADDDESPYGPEAIAGSRGLKHELFGEKETTPDVEPGLPARASEARSRSNESQEGNSGSGHDEDAAALGIHGMPSWEQGLNDADVHNIRHFIKASRAWDQSLLGDLESDEPPTLRKLNKKDLAAVLPPCRWRGCGFHALESVASDYSRKELAGLYLSEDGQSIVYNFATRGYSTCRNHPDEPQEQYPPTRLKGFEECGHQVPEEACRLSENERRLYTTRIPGESDLLCTVQVPIWEQRLQDGTWQELGMFRTEDGRHYCSMLSYVKEQTFTECPSA